MEILNVGKRTIDGIKPMERKKLDKSHGERLVKLYAGELEVLSKTDKKDKK